MNRDRQSKTCGEIDYENMQLKICGLSRFGDILAANDILPDYIGFVFAESSRRVTPDKVPS